MTHGNPPRPPSDKDKETLIGRVFAGTYRLDAELGRGAMGIVYRAYNQVLDQDVAVKVLAPELAADEHVRSRLLQEARALTLLSHRNIVPVRHCGEEDGLLFVVMGLCPGETLASLIERDAPLPEARVTHIATQILLALSEAHEAGIVHRDLKPDNVMIEARPGLGDASDDHVRVLDFGLARIVGNARAQLPGALETVDGHVVGTVAYMSPEQVRAATDVDARSDLFSLGIVLYEMLAGRRPFESDSALSVMMRILEATPAALRVPALASGDSASPLRACVTRALQKERKDRFQTAGEFMAGLQGQIDFSTAPPTRAVAAAARPAATRPTRSPGQWVGLALLALALGFGAFQLLSNEPPVAHREAARAAAGRCAHTEVIAHMQALARTENLTGEDLLALAWARIALRDPDAVRELDLARRLLPTSDARSHLARGHFEWHVRADYEAALEAFAIAILKDSTSTDAFAGQVGLYLDGVTIPHFEAVGTDPLARAKTDIQTLERHAPLDPRVPLLRGRLGLERMKRSKGAAVPEDTVQRALADLELAGEQAPRWAEPAWHVADLHVYIAGRARDAKAYDRMRAVQGAALLALDESIERLEANPHHRCQSEHQATIYHARSLARLALGDADGAVDDLRKAHAGGQDVREFIQMAEGLRNAGHLDEATALYARLVEATHATEAYFKLAYCHERQGKALFLQDDRVEAAAAYERAVVALTGSLSQSPDVPLVKAYRGEVHLRLSEVDAAGRDAHMRHARQDFESAASNWGLRSSRIELDHRYAEFLCRVGDVPLARTRLAAAVAAHDHHTPAVYARFAQVLICSAATAIAEDDADVSQADLAAAWTLVERLRKMLKAPSTGLWLLAAEVHLAQALLGATDADRKAALVLAATAFAEAGRIREPDDRGAERRSALGSHEVALYVAKEAGKVAAARRAGWRAGRLRPGSGTYTALASALAGLGRPEDAARARSAATRAADQGR